MLCGIHLRVISRKVLMKWRLITSEQILWIVLSEQFSFTKTYFKTKYDFQSRKLIKCHLLSVGKFVSASRLTVSCFHVLHRRGVHLPLVHHNLGGEVIISLHYIITHHIYIYIYIYIYIHLLTVHKRNRCSRFEAMFFQITLDLRIYICLSDWSICIKCFLFGYWTVPMSDVRLPLGASCPGENSHYMIILQSS